MTTTIGSTILGYPRQGPRRALKRAVEDYWSGSMTADDLLARAAAIRRERTCDQHAAGVNEIPSNDFSLYDHVLDTAMMLGAAPSRFIDAVPDVTTATGWLERCFAMARGTSAAAPLEMTKWFDTNYHYLTPELGPGSTFTLDARKPLAEFLEAKADGVVTRPVILGPVTFLELAKAAPDAPRGFHPRVLLGRVLPVYQELLAVLYDAGAEWVQLDEPALVLDQEPWLRAAIGAAYDVLCAPMERPKVLLATYFDRAGDVLPVLKHSPLDGLALDFTGPAAANLDHLLLLGGVPDKRLVAGVVDGRNVWANDLSHSITVLESLVPLASQVDVSSSCSLMHVPLDLADETSVPADVSPWLAFASQKLHEIATLATGLSGGRHAIRERLVASDRNLAARRSSALACRTDVRQRAANVRADDLARRSPYATRVAAQRLRLELPILPTTTIGSFPQTDELRRIRGRVRRGTMATVDYENAIRAAICAAIELQENCGLDVLVHGEPERNDMVQYFAEQLDGFLVTEHGWVQSYGTRYVRPPIIVGDVSRPTAMTVPWTTYASNLTKKPVKGMLTGPVTMLAWSFVRDDLPNCDVARQVALALRDEVQDLESTGVRIIQVDEPALREMLPLRRANRAAYVLWAVEAFRLATAGVRDGTQIHTHMCYAEFGDILDALVSLDVDVISLEAARSGTAIVDELAEAEYSNEIGPGVWDIHSPRVPTVQEIEERLAFAVDQFPADRIWVNPDCGLKTRGYPEVRASLTNLVEATRHMRAEFAS